MTDIQQNDLTIPREELSTAVDLYQAMAMTFWLPETAAALTQVEA